VFPVLTKKDSARGADPFGSDAPLNLRSRRLSMKTFRFLAALALLFSLAIPAFSQSTTAGDITGSVTDPSGAVVPNAKVAAKSEASGSSLSTTTNGEGAYRFSLLQPGGYVLSIEVSGFQPANRKVQVAVGQVITANFQLTVTGGVTTVEVTAGAINTDIADVTTGVNLQQVLEVPNPGNDLSAIAQLAPGSVMNTQSGFGNFSSFGLPGTSNVFTVDGMVDNDPFLNLNNSGATNLLLGANDIQEATITSNGYSGQNGQLAGAQINYVTRTGSNTFHGNAIYYWDGRLWNANSFINNNSSTKRPFVNANQWAASFGGPIQKDKTFFFWNYEGLRVILPTSNLVKVPTQAFQTATIANLTGTGLAASVPFYQNMFNIWNQSAAGHPLSAVSGDSCNGLALPGGVPCAVQFRSTAANFTHEYDMSLKIDHIFSEKDKVFGRVQRDAGVQATSTDPLNPIFNTQSTQPEWQGQLNWTHFFSNGTNSFLGSLLWYSAIFDNANRAATLKVFPTTLQLNDGTLSTLGGSDFFFPQGRNVTQYQFVDDYSLIKGKHTLKFGVNFRRYDVYDHDYGTFTSGLIIPFTLTDFFNGGASGDIGLFNFPSRLSQPMALYGLGFYGQDEWRLTPHLKVTATLRLDHNSNPVCQTNCFANLVSPFTSLSHTNSGNIPYNQTIRSGLHQAYPATDVVVWQPRLGFAWSPFKSEKTVISGGIGIFSDSFPAFIVDQFSSNAPLLNAFTPSSLPLAFTQPGNLQAAAASSNASLLTAFASGGTFNSISASNPLFGAPNFTTANNTIRQPRYQEWNFQVQQNLGWKSVLSLNYVGNHGIFEPVANNGLNAFAPASGDPASGFTNGFTGLPTAPPDLRFSRVTQIQSIAVSNYNGLVTSLRHTVTGGFTMQLNYTYSHALDEFSNGGLLQFNLGTDASIINPANPFKIRGNYGNADYDVRHYFSANYVWDNSLRHLFKWGPKAVFSGWTVAGTVFTRSGLPFTVINGAATGALSGNNYGGTVFANIIGPTQSGTCGTKAATGASPTPCLNSSGFTPTNTALGAIAQSSFGNQARNQFRGPGYFDTDLHIFKRTNIPGWERGQLEIGFQFFNLFNHPNFDQPVNDINNGLFGTITRELNPPTSILGSFLGGDASPRLIQLKLQFIF
jgi:outer membrane receptor protein involved in Fe transport